METLLLCRGADQRASTRDQKLRTEAEWKTGVTSPEAFGDG
jgi:hypothetical protein